jgi:hypothetical protein
MLLINNNVFQIDVFYLIACKTDGKNMADMSGHLFCSSGQLLFYLYV